MKQTNTTIIKTKSENKSSKFYVGFMLEKTLASRSLNNHITNSLVPQNGQGKYQR